MKSERLRRQTAKLKSRTVVFTRHCIPRAVAAVAGTTRSQVTRRVAVLQSRVAPLEVVADGSRRFRWSAGESTTSHGVSRCYGFRHCKAVAAATCPAFRHAPLVASEQRSGAQSGGKP